MNLFAFIPYSASSAGVTVGWCWSWEVSCGLKGLRIPTEPFFSPSTFLVLPTCSLYAGVVVLPLELYWHGISEVWLSYKGLYAILSSWQNGLEDASSVTEMQHFFKVLIRCFIDLADFSGAIILNPF